MLGVAMRREELTSVDKVKVRIIAETALLRSGFEEITDADKEWIIDFAKENPSSIPADVTPGTVCGKFLTHVKGKLCDPLKTSIPETFHNDLTKFFLPGRIGTIFVENDKVITINLQLSFPVNPQKIDDERFTMMVSFRMEIGVKSVSVLDCTLVFATEKQIADAAVFYALYRA